MAYGKISDDQWKAIRKHVEGRVVHDVGAGSCEYSLGLLKAGAASVVAIDKERMPSLDRGIKRIQTSFDLFLDPVDTAFLSWPTNGQTRGLLEIARRAKTVIYVGKNTDGTMCASPDFFIEMSRREVLDYVPERRNTLIVYGRRLARPRKMLGEENAGATAYSGGPPVTFEQAEDPRKKR